MDKSDASGIKCVNDDIVMANRETCELFSALGSLVGLRVINDEIRFLHISLRRYFIEI